MKKKMRKRNKENNNNNNDKNRKKYSTNLLSCYYYFKVPQAKGNTTIDKQGATSSRDRGNNYRRQIW